MLIFILKLLRHFVPPPLLTEEELVTFSEEREYFNSPSVYRGSTPKGGGSLKNDFWGHPRFLKNGRNGRVTARDVITL